MKKWTDEEIEILKENYTAMSHNILCRTLPNRTWGAIKKKAKQLKVSYFGFLNDQQRFWEYVDKKSDVECWHWTGCCTGRGYGQIKINMKMIYTHRFSWQIHFGEIPKDLCVLHKCDNPICVNPKHLFLGTQEDNIFDMHQKDRQAKGENHGQHKLTVKQVEQIRGLKEKYTQREIAKMFDVCHATIASIHSNITWKS